jgi:hypothetical protein
VTSAALADVRAAASLAHALPGCVVELAGACGSRTYVGFQPLDGVELTPCALRRALGLVWPHACEELAPLVGLPAGPIRARVLDERMGDRHLGLGVYRLGEWECAFLFASLLPVRAVERTLREAVADIRGEGSRCAEALEHAAVEVCHDPQIETSVVVMSFCVHAGPLDACEGLALRLAASCGVAELLETTRDETRRVDG